MDINKESPFRPGTPVPPNMFVGRQNELNKIIRYLNQCSNGRQQHVFLVGERGIGKSSLASYVMNYAKKQKKMLGIHIFLDGKTDLNTVIKEIIETLLNEIQGEKWYNTVSELFQKHIESINLGVTVKFNPPTEDLTVLTKEFPEVLKKIIETINKEKNGIFIVLDDINGLTQKPTFANWYKSFNDTIATKYPDNFPVFIMLVGYQEKLNALYSHNESFVRIFHQAEIQHLDDAEVRTFFENTFNKIGIKVDEKAMKELIHFSSGMPTIMHEIGDATFWADTDSIIDEEDALKGVLEAGDEIGRKYLKKNIRSIRSEDYKNIFKKLGENLLNEFTREDLKKILTSEERKKITNFLNRSKELGIIIPKNERGTYKFANNLYPIYFLIESSRLHEKKNLEN